MVFGVNFFKGITICIAILPIVHSPLFLHTSLLTFVVTAVCHLYVIGFRKGDKHGQIYRMSVAWSQRVQSQDLRR